MLLPLIAAALLSCALQPGAEPPSGTPRSAPLTIAERTSYRQTARYDDVNAFLKQLAADSPLVRLSDIGKSGEDRAIPLALIADPPVSTPEEARRSGKLIVLLLGGIHSGECDGKEALLALARDAALTRGKSPKKKGENPPEPESDKEPIKPSEPEAQVLASSPAHLLTSSTLDHLILAFVPLYNPDGNERLDPKNRPGQVGPDTMGIRENSARLDLNRDFVKLEAPETRVLLRFINKWDPAILIDTHTTNGSLHRYLLTYDTNKNPAGDEKLTDYCRNTLLPAIAAAAKEKANIDTFWYGNFEQDHTRWETYPDQPRYGINYFGMRNRIAILTESYSYAPYKERIDAQYAFVAAALDHAAAKHDEISRLLRDADTRTTGDDARRGRAGPPGGPGRRGRGRGGPDDAPSILNAPAPGPGGADDRCQGWSEAEPLEEALSDSFRPEGADEPRHAGPSAPVIQQPEPTQPPAPAREDKKPPDLVLRSTLTPSDSKATIKGFVEERRDNRTVPGDAKDYEVDLLITFKPDLTVPRPQAYIIPPPGADNPLSIAAFDRIVQTLQRHGIRLDETREDIDLDASAYRVDAVTKAMRPFQGHATLAVKATRHDAPRRFPAGSILIKTGQPLGTLAAYLLEPEADDGLTTWNFLDDALKIGDDFPVYRLDKAPPITSIAPPPLPEDREAKKPVTFETVFESDNPPNFTGSPIGGLTWLDDGEHFLQTKDGQQYKVEAATGRAEVFIDPKPIAAALEQLPTIGKRNADSIARRQGRFTKDRSAFVFEHQNDLYYCKTDGSAAARLTSSPQREEVWSLSPDGAFVGFVRDNDLWVVDAATRTERALTTGGSDTLRRGKADWVYYEEVFNRNPQTYWWSPDSSRIVFYEIDSSPIRPYTIVNDVPEPNVVERTLYPKVGQPNPIAKLLVVQVAGGEPQDIDLSQYMPQDMLILNAGWYPDSSRVIFYISNRTQTYADVLWAGADGGATTKLFRETTGAWVDSPPAPRFLKDGSFFFTSERSGFKHFYRYDRDGKLLHQVTDGDWEARSIVELDEDHGWLYFSGTRDNPIAENLYRTHLDGTGPERLTTTDGAHRADVSPSGKYFIDSWSSHTQPTRVALHKTEGEGGAVLVRTLDTNPVRDLDRYILGRAEMVQIPTPDGFLLEGNILRPADFDPSRKYPVWFTTYGGPQAPTITDSWAGRSWDQVLAHLGFIVFRADPRSASGKGAKFAWPIYKNLGIHELEDIETAITWLSKNPWIDPSRIGMSGHSYGGFMTSFALTHSKLFAAGIAGAPVTDWRDYDSIYTERFMLTPQENPEGYKATSVVRAAKDLHGRLLLLHGAIDDNVHLQNSWRLVRALQQANKQFELMLYPEARHGIGGRHYQRLMIEFIQRTLGTPGPAPTSPETAPAERSGTHSGP